MKVVDHDKKYSGHGHHTCYTQNPFYDFRILLEHRLVPVQPQYQLAIAHPSGTLTTDTFSSVLQCEQH